MNTKSIMIQSMSDVITNSSTEVFMVYDSSAFDNIKKLVNAILELGGAIERFDDLFEIKATVSSYFVEEYPEYESLSEEEILAKATEIDEDKYDGYPFVNGYEVTAKTPKGEELARLLSDMDNIFETYARYC